MKLRLKKSVICRRWQRRANKKPRTDATDMFWTSMSKIGVRAAQDRTALYRPPTFTKGCIVVFEGIIVNRLENILQRKLENPWIACGSHLSEGIRSVPEIYACRFAPASPRGEFFSS